MAWTTVFAINAHVAVAHFQGQRGDWGPAYAAVRFNVVFDAIVQPFWRDIAFTKDIDAVGYRDANTATDWECYAVIAFFRPDVDGFRAGIQHHRAHFEVIACTNATGLGTIIGVFEPVTFGIQTGGGFTHFNIQIGEVFTLLNAAPHGQCGTRYGSQSGKEKDIKLFHGVYLVIRINLRTP